MDSRLKTIPFIYHPDTRLHEVGSGHPEHSGRVQAIVDAVKEHPIGSGLRIVEPVPADIRWIETVHTSGYRRRIEDLCLAGHSYADSGDTRISHDSYQAALLACGSALAAVDEVATGRATAAFACARPPGHHARSAAAMGFCLFNNVAIAACYAQRQHQLERIFILDWDVHHGNGTQEAFYTDPSVFFCSLHQHPHYPGTGMADEIGAADGIGTTLNLPLPAGSSYPTYENAFRNTVLPAITRFRPDLILTSAGFDAHRLDPLGDMLLDDDDFGRLTERVTETAANVCEGRIVSILEGGYHLPSLARSVHKHLEALVSGANQ